MQPSHEKACFFSFREHAFPQALFISSKQFLQPRFYRFLSILVSFLEPIWAPLANFFDSNFRDSKNTNCLSRGTPQAEGIWDTSRVRGELEASGRHLGASGGIREASGAIWRHLGGIWGSYGKASGRHLEASGKPGLPRGPQGDLRGLRLKKVIHLSAKINIFMKKY